MELKGGKVYVNGTLLEEPYAAGETWEQTSGIVRYPYTVQDGQIFVVGDNRSVSMDSRNFGAAGARQIKGKIQFCAERSLYGKCKIVRQRPCSAGRGRFPPLLDY